MNIASFTDKQRQRFKYHVIYVHVVVKLNNIKNE